MNAEQMFEELGYEKKEESEGVLIYISDFENSILFEKKRVTITNLYCYGRITININHLLENAIHKQCEELGWLEDEQQEIKQETNLERYFDDIGIFGINSFAVTNGKPMRCKDVHCDKCDFCGHCGGERLIWLTSPFKKPPYKLNRFEYDLIKTFDHCKECCLLNEIESLKKLSEKGYFEGINPFTKVHEILENCEVIKDVKG